MKRKLATLNRAPRRNTDPVRVTSVSSIENLSKIASQAEIIEASITGFKIIVNRKDLVPEELRTNLNIDSLIGTRILIYLDQMNLEITGVIRRTKLLGKIGYELGVDYSEDAPEYWRECLLELLPYPGEFKDEH